jgi:integrase
LSHEEASTLLEELAKRSQQVHDQALLSLLSGLRFGEIAALTWADADIKHGIIAIRSPKSGEGRQTFMTEEVKAMLAARKPEGVGAQHLIFPDRKGNIQKSVSDAFERAVEKLGFNEGISESPQKVVFHTLRHTFASWLALDGTALYTIKELMGHKTLTMTERYAHLIPDHKREALNAMANGFRVAEHLGVENG